MDAVAFDSLTKETLEDVLQHGAKEISGTGCLLVPKDIYERFIEDVTDWRLAMEASKRLKNPDKKLLTEREVLESLGITEEQIAAVGDVELD